MNHRIYCELRSHKFRRMVKQYRRRMRDMRLAPALPWSAARSLMETARDLAKWDLT